MEGNKVSLLNLARGGAIERFDEELKKVLENVCDHDTGDGPREILLRVRIRPTPERNTASVSVHVTSKVVPPKPTATLFYIGMDRVAGAIAQEHNPEQLKLGLQEPGPPELRVVEGKEGEAK